MSIRSQGKILHFFSTASKSVDSESTSPVGEDLLTGPDADTDSESESETGECEASACPGSVETSSSTSTNRACKCQACTDICTPHHPVEVDVQKGASCTALNRVASRNLIRGQFRVHGTALTLGSVFAQLNTKCIVQHVALLIIKAC